MEIMEKKFCCRKEDKGLGFRQSHNFNLALLGKHGWNLVSTPNSLVSRLLKARYYPPTSFLEAHLGNNPSFVWRSVWMAMSVIALDIRYRIGNEEMINMWKDSWIKDNPNFKPTTLVIDGMEDLKVATLWSHEMHC